MTARREISGIFEAWADKVKQAIELLWLLTIFLVPLVFATPGVMDNGYEVPRVTLYRSLVGLIAALCLVEWGHVPAFSGRPTSSGSSPS